MSAVEFPGYRCQRLLYQGPTTRVWQVKGVNSKDSQFALKEFLGSHSALLLRELSSLSALQHRHIVQCLDAGLSESGGAFLVFELASKGSLRQMLSRGPLTVDAWLRLAAHLLSALALAHSHQIIHRDLKPDNVLVFGRRIPVFKISDLGLSAFRGQRLVGPVQGTPAYMAPEQFAGEISTRSDLYSLGMLLYEAGLGKLPFGEAASSYEALRLQHETQPINWSDWKIPRWMGWLERFLCKNPSDRHVNAQSALEELLHLPSKKVPAKAPRSEYLALPAECLPVLRLPVEGCLKLFFVPRQERLQLWSSHTGSCAVWERSAARRWGAQPAGPPVQAWETAPDRNGLWIGQGRQISYLDWTQTRPRRQLRLAHPVDQLLYCEQSRVLLVASQRFLCAFQDGESLLWSLDLPHYWGALALAHWDFASVGVTVGPNPSQLLRIEVASGRILARIDLPAPSLALGQSADRCGVSLVLADLTHFGTGATGIWSVTADIPQLRQPLAEDLSWARSHPLGFSCGRGSLATHLVDTEGKTIAQIPSRGTVAADCWSGDGISYAWLEDENGHLNLRIAELLFRCESGTPPKDEELAWKSSL